MPETEKDTESGRSVFDKRGRWDFLPTVLRGLKTSTDNDSSEYPEDERWCMDTRVRSIQGAPSGWPRTAAFVDSDSKFRIFRRFGFLRTRLLFYHQDTLRDIEERLTKIDQDDYSRENTRRFLTSRTLDDAREDAERKALFHELAAELTIYDQLLNDSAKIYHLEDASAIHRQSVANLIWNDGSLALPDREYIQHIDDLVCLQGDTEDSWVHFFVSKCINYFGSPTRNLFRTETQERKLAGNTLSLELFAKRRFDAFVNFSFTLIIVILVMGPVMLLYFLRNRDGYLQNATAMICTASFALLCSTATKAKKHELIAVTAAYCGVLVVFTSQNSAI